MTVCNIEYITAVWNRLDLRSMSSITENALEDLREKGCDDDQELLALVSFFNDRL